MDKSFLGADDSLKNENTVGSRFNITLYNVCLQENIVKLRLIVKSRIVNGDSTVLQSMQTVPKTRLISCDLRCASVNTVVSMSTNVRT